VFDADAEQVVSRCVWPCVCACMQYSWGVWLLLL